MSAGMIQWLSLTVIAATTAASMGIAGLNFDCTSAIKLAVVCAGIQMLAWFYGVRRPDERLTTTLSLIVKLIIFSALATLLSYAVAATDRPTWDQTLLFWDQSLGFDWFAHLSLMQSHPILDVACRAAYQSVAVQTFVAVGVLGLSGHLKRAEEFVVSYSIAGLVAVIVSGLMPAIAMFIHIESDTPYRRLIDTPFVTILQSLRDGSLKHITLAQMDGIITFPSFHAALGIIFGYSFCVFHRARWIGFAVNGLLIAGTPINGGHYFVDVIAGMVLGVVAVWAARRATATRLLPRHSAEHAMQSNPQPRPIASA